MSRGKDRQALLMALAFLGATSVAVVDRASAPAHDVVGRVLAPPQSALHAASARVEQVFTGAKDVAELQSRVETLQERNDVLVVENTKVRELARENAELRELLEFAEQRVDLDLRGASVVGRTIAEEPGNLRHTLKLGIGSRHGIQSGMPVANDRGLIGRVARVGRDWSDVLLVSDPGSAIQARIERTRETGVVFGTTSGDVLMRFIPQDIDAEPNVQVGDLVFTSGLSREFPPMIAIGQVVEVRQSDVETHQEAVIRPTVDFSSLELVLVVRTDRSDDAIPGP